MNTFLWILLALDVVLALSLVAFAIMRSHKRFYNAEKEGEEPIYSIEVDALRKDQTPLVIGDLDLSFAKKEKK